MKAITVRQPWAWGIVHGAKAIENRSRRITYRGPIVIHAGAARVDHRRRPTAEWAALMPGLPDLTADTDRHFGCLYGVARLVDCVPVAEVAGDPFAEGPWCLILEERRPIDPVPYRGRLFLFDVPDDLIRIAG